MIYEVGHKVRVVTNLTQGQYDVETGFLKALSFYKDKVMTVKELKYLNGTNKIIYKLEEDPNNFNWSPEFLVHVVEEQEETEVINTSDEEIHSGTPVNFMSRLSGTEVGISIPVTPTTSTIIPVAKHRRALVMFSGGFDSVALAVKVIESGDFDEVTLLYEQVTIFDDHKQLAYNIFKELVKRYKDKKVIILFDTINLDLDWVTNPGEDHFWGERDLCLMIHLTTIFGKGQYGSIFLGWNKSNITKLNYARDLIAFLEKFRNSSSTIYFLEDKFLNYDWEQDMDMTWKAGVTKRRVVRLLLEHKLFAMCSAEGQPTHENHWYDTSGKWREVVNALIDLDFTAKELSTVFKYKTLDTVQRIWDKRSPKRVRVTNKVKVVEEVEVEEQVVVEE